MSTSNPTLACLDSGHYDINQLLAQVPGDPVDTVIGRSHSFTFISGGTYFDLKYVFASDEYDTNIYNVFDFAFGGTWPTPSDSTMAQRICGKFNDGIGIFLHGPGIIGPYSYNSENIAVVPNTSLPVCVRTIHPTLNINTSCSTASYPQYFVQGSNNNFPFDGYTTPLHVKQIQINPCDTYTVRITIGQATLLTTYQNGSTVMPPASSLGASAIIVEKASAKTGFWQPAPLQLYAGLGADTLVEGCPGMIMQFVRFFHLNQPDSIHLVYEGSANWGTDYDSLPEWVYFQPGEDTIQFEITPTSDSLSEGIENLIIRLMPPGVYNCPVDTTEVELWIADRPPLNAVIADTFFFNPCETDSIAIGPDTVSGLGPFTYAWSTGASTPMILVAPLNNENYSLTITDACQLDSLVFTMVVREAPDPVFSLINDSITITCSDTLQPIGFSIDTNYYPQLNYRWDNGLTDSIRWVNPLLNGNYTYHVTVYLPCAPDSFVLPLHVSVVNDPVLVQLDNIHSEHCPGHPFDIVPAVSGGYPPYRFSWSTGDSTTTINAWPMVTTSYTLSVTDVCAIDTVVRTMSLTVPVHKPMDILGPDQFVLPCPTGYVNITENMYFGIGGTGNGVNQNHYAFSWNDWLSVGKTLKFFTDHDTVLTLQMRDTCENDTAVKKIPVYVFKGPFLRATLDDTLHLCLGEPSVIGPLVSDGVLPYVFLWNDQSTDSARAIIPTEPLRSFSVSVTDFCNFQKRLETVVSATKPQANFEATNDSYDPNIVRFENRSERALTYTWVFSDGGQSDQEHPEYRYNDLDEATVKLVAEDRYGCRDSVESDLEIPLSLFIPNAFTPNNDPFNALWQPLGFGFKALSYTIFDRWGQPVFTCTLPECTGWDGTQKGQLVPEGTYSYVIIVDPINGNKREVSGNVTVVR